MCVNELIVILERIRERYGNVELETPGGGPLEKVDVMLYRKGARPQELDRITAEDLRREAEARKARVFYV